MHRTLPGHDNAVTAQRDLCDDIGTIVIFRPHVGDLLVERLVLGDRLQRGKGHRHAGFAAEVAHPAEFVPFPVEIAGQFEHAITDPPHRPADADQLFLGRGGAGDQFAVDAAMQDGARGRETECAGFQPVLDNLRHLFDLVLGRNRTRLFPVAQDIGTYRTVRDMGCDIDGARHSFQLVEIFGKRLPVPTHPFGQRGAGNILDAFHKIDQPLVPVGPRRGKSDAAIAHYHRGDAMPAGRRHFVIPGRLAVIMGVHIDKARRHIFPGCINLFAALRGNRPDQRYAITIDRNVGYKRLAARSVNDGSATNYQIMHRVSPLYFRTAYQI